MPDNFNDRIRMPALRERVTDATEAALWIKDGMTVGMSGFTKAGDAKAVPLAAGEESVTAQVSIVWEIH